VGNRRDLKMKLIGYRILIRFHISSDGVWEYTPYTPHYNYKIYSTEGVAKDAVKDMINSGAYSTTDEFMIEPIYIKIAR
jgi:hypothetical protein